MSLFTVKPTLRGALVTLRPFTESDIAAMGPILADPELLRLTASVHSTAEALAQSPHLDAETRRWYETRAEQQDRLDLAIVDLSTGECVGEVVLNNVDFANDSCSFRILIGAAGRDRGLGSDATRLILTYAFATTRLNRIALEVYVFNPRAMRMYERVGFRSEGRLRAALKFDDAYIDAIVMSMLREDHGDETAPRLVPGVS